MRIGFDISQTGNNKAGCGFFADSLILALTEIDRENEYILYPNFGTTFWDPKWKKNTRRILKPNVSRKVMGRTWNELMRFWSHFPADGETLLGAPDIIQANNYSCPKDLKTAKVVYTLYDLSAFEYPEFTSEQNRWVCFNGVFDASNHADYIISISKYSRTKFLEVFPHYPLDRIRVVYPGSRFLRGGQVNDAIRSRIGLMADRFWLAVGTLEPRKNLRRLLKAYSIHKKENKTSYPLVVAGGTGWMEEDLIDFVGELDLENDVKMLGYVSDDELGWLYKNCFAFLYPSIYEGFGLPVLEAITLGAAVIASSTTSIPEVAGNAVFYVDPYKEEEMVQAFSSLLDGHGYRERLKALAVEQARNFSWKGCATEVLDIYRHLIKLPKRGGTSE